MNTFPIIYNMDQFRGILQHKKEIKLKKEIVDGIEVGIICYMLETENTFDSILARECRGITFRIDTGEILSRPLHKFWNVNQNNISMQSNIDWNNIEYIDTKYDGSMVTPVLVNGKVFLKTKKSFYSTVALKAQEYYNTLDDTFKQEVLTSLLCGNTMIFEFIAPDNQIVIEYPHTSFELLHVRNNITGEYNFRHVNKKVIDLYSIPKSIDMVRYIFNLKEIEGFVFSDGKDFFKLKTEWYLIRHKTLSKISIKSIIEMYITDKIDDVIAELNTIGYTEKAKTLINYKNEFDAYFLNEQEYALSKLEELKRKYKRTELRIQVSQDPKYASLMYAILDDKNYEELIKKRIKVHFLDKYKHTTLFLGE